MFELSLDYEKTNFQPGEPVAGTLNWSGLVQTQTHFEVRLIWYTVGKGSRDVGIGGVQRIDCTNQPTGKARFELIAPHRPISCSGRLLSIVWAVEVISFPERGSTKQTITIGPGAKEVELTKELSDAAKAAPMMKTYRFK